MLADDEIRDTRRRSEEITHIHIGDPAGAARCPMLSVRADAIEPEVLAHIRWYVAHPKETAEEIARQVCAEQGDAEGVRADLERIQALLADTQRERDTVLVLYRRGRINDADLDRQLDDIAAGERALLTRQAAAQERIAAATVSRSELAAVETALTEMQSTLAANLDYPTQRRLVDALLAHVQAILEPAGRRWECRYRIGDQVVSAAPRHTAHYLITACIG